MIESTSPSPTFLKLEMISIIFGTTLENSFFDFFDLSFDLSYSKFNSALIGSLANECETLNSVGKKTFAFQTTAMKSPPFSS